LLDTRNIALGLAVLFLARTNGLLYILNTVDDNDLSARSVKRLVLNAVCFLVFFLFFLITLMLSAGLTFTGGTPGIVVEHYKYLHNFLHMPAVFIIFLAGVIAVLAGIGITIFKGSRKGIWYTGAGTIVTVFALFLVAGFNNSTFYPSVSNFGSSLTIYNASSSYFTLKTMMYVSFIIPFVAAYIWYAWKEINKKKITSEEMNEVDHLY
jgi:cytochrome d ubiquinol oxidase subunit II